MYLYFIHICLYKYICKYFYIIYKMTIDIHKVITGNPISKNLMKPWGSNKKRTIFNKYTGPGNDL